MLHDRVIMFQVKAYFMADVIFPHSVHTYWLGCKNCHPKIFNPKLGANPMSMKAIWEGRYCGKCHGSVAFPLGPDENCRRCHSLPKRL